MLPAVLADDFLKLFIYTCCIAELLLDSNIAESLK